MKNKTPNIIIVKILFIIIVLGLSSCGSKKIVDTNNDIYPPKLIFLNYNIEKLENGEKSVRFINKVIADGELKRHSNKYLENGVTGDLQCNQLDKNSNTLQMVIIKNPLKKTFESLNDSLSFERKTVELKNTSFSIKLQLKPNTEYITIDEIIKSKKTSKPLIRTKLY